MRPLQSMGIALTLILILSCKQSSQDRPPAFQARARVTTQGVGLAIGDSLSRPDARPWSRDTVSAIIIAPNCHSCSNAEKEFENHVYAYCQAHSLPAFYVVAAESPVQKDLQELERLHRPVLRLDLKSVGLLRLPTILRVSSNGVIRSMWTGVAPRNERDKALRALISGPNVESYKRIRNEDFQEGRLPSDAQLLALSSRMSTTLPQHAQKPAVIPILQLAGRAPRELFITRSTYILCSTADDVLQCQDAAIILARAGFTNVYAVGLPTRPAPAPQSNAPQLDGDRFNGR